MQMNGLGMHLERMNPKHKMLQPIQKRMQPNKDQLLPVVESVDLTDKQSFFVFSTLNTLMRLSISEGL